MLSTKASPRAQRFPDGSWPSDFSHGAGLLRLPVEPIPIHMLIGTSVRDPGIDCAFDSSPEVLIIEPNSTSLLFRLSKVSLHLRQNFCFFGCKTFRKVIHSSACGVAF